MMIKKEIMVISIIFLLKFIHINRVKNIFANSKLIFAEFQKIWPLIQTTKTFRALHLLLTRRKERVKEKFF